MALFLSWESEADGMRCSELEHFSHEEQHLIGEESIADLSQVQAGFDS